MISVANSIFRLVFTWC